MVIYKCTNIVNSKKYIGKTINYEKRIKQHIRNAKNKKLNYPIYKAIRKYGIENFKWEILAECINEIDLNNKEREFIKSEKSTVYENGYNLSYGGDGQLGYKHTDEFKNNLSKRMMNNQYTLGRTLSEEHKIKLKKSSLGSKCPNKGRAFTKERKLHLSKILKGRIFSEEHKKKLCEFNRSNSNKNVYTFVNKELLMFTGTMLDFKEKYSLDRSTITKLVNKKIKSTKGWSLME